MQVKKRKAFGLFLHEARGSEELARFFISVFYAHFFCIFWGQRNNLRDFIFKHII